ARGLVAVQACGVPVDLTGIQHRVAAFADVHEGRLHARQHILDSAQVDVADHRALCRPRDVVLDEHPILQDSDLGAVVLPPHDHGPFYALAAGQELGLGDDGAATTGLASLTTALPLGLQPGGPTHPGDLLAGPARLPGLAVLTAAVAAMAPADRKSVV